MAQNHQTQNPLFKALAKAIQRLIVATAFATLVVSFR